jgi:murein DD-endopeptidase MepM/ murein hydrolase activator NlpD
MEKLSRAKATALVVVFILTAICFAIAFWHGSKINAAAAEKPYKKTAYLYKDKKTTVLAIYEKASAKSKVLAIKPYGTKLTIIKKKKKGAKYYKVQIEKTIGYTRYVRKKKPHIPLVSFKIKSDKALKTGEKYRLELKLVPVTASVSLKKVKWSSSNKEKLSASRKNPGVVSAKKGTSTGSVKITAEYKGLSASKSVFINSKGYLRPVRIFQEPVTGATFGARRDSKRDHAAMDFAVLDGKNTPVYAIANGTLIWYDDYWEGTCALYVRNDDGTIFCYGEIKTTLKNIKKRTPLNKRIRQGQQIGKMIPNKAPENGATMLHLEYFKGKTKDKIVYPDTPSLIYSLVDTKNETYDYIKPPLDKKKFQRRRDLLDPTFIFSYPVW